MTEKRNPVTIAAVHMDPDGKRAWARLTGPRPRYPVTVDFDPDFRRGSQFRVPKRYRRKHVYIMVGPRATKCHNPPGSGVVVRHNCGGGAGGP